MMNQYVADTAKRKREDYERKDKEQRQDSAGIAKARTERSGAVTDMSNYNALINAQHSGKMSELFSCMYPW